MTEVIPPKSSPDHNSNQPIGKPDAPGTFKGVSVTSDIEPSTFFSTSDPKEERKPLLLDRAPSVVDKKIESSNEQHDTKSIDSGFVGSEAGDDLAEDNTSDSGEANNDTSLSITTKSTELSSEQTETSEEKDDNPFKRDHFSRRAQYKKREKRELQKNQPDQLQKTGSSLISSAITGEDRLLENANIMKRRFQSTWQQAEAAFDHFKVDEIYQLSKKLIQSNESKQLIPLLLCSQCSKGRITQSDLQKKIAPYMQAYVEDFSKTQFEALLEKNISPKISRTLQLADLSTTAEERIKSSHGRVGTIQNFKRDTLLSDFGVSHLIDFELLAKKSDEQLVSLLEKELQKSAQTEYKLPLTNHKKEKIKKDLKKMYTSITEAQIREARTKWEDPTKRKEDDPVGFDNPRTVTIYNRTREMLSNRLDHLRTKISSTFHEGFPEITEKGEATIEETIDKNLKKWKVPGAKPQAKTQQNNHALQQQEPIKRSDQNDQLTKDKIKEIIIKKHEEHHQTSASPPKGMSANITQSIKYSIKENSDGTLNTAFKVPPPSSKEENNQKEFLEQHEYEIDQWARELWQERKSLYKVHPNQNNPLHQSSKQSDTLIEAEKPVWTSALSPLDIDDIKSKIQTAYIEYLRSNKEAPKKLELNINNLFRVVIKEDYKGDLDISYKAGMSDYRAFVVKNRKELNDWIDDFWKGTSV